MNCMIVCFIHFHHVHFSFLVYVRHFLNNTIVFLAPPLAQRPRQPPSSPNQGPDNAPGRHFSGGRHVWLKEGIANGLCHHLVVVVVVGGRHFSTRPGAALPHVRALPLKVRPALVILVFVFLSECHERSAVPVSAPLACTVAHAAVLLVTSYLFQNANLYCIYSSPFATGGSLVGLAPQTKLQAPQIETRNTINQWRFGQFSECQDPRTNAKTPY